MKIEILPQSFYSLLDVLMQIINDGVLWEFFFEDDGKIETFRTRAQFNQLYTYISPPTKT